MTIAGCEERETTAQATAARETARLCRALLHAEEINMDQKTIIALRKYELQQYRQGGRK